MKILLIEESETCSECLLGIYNRRWFCLATNKDIDLLKSRYEKSSWCPLKSLPSFKAVDLNDTRDVVMFCHGWNTLLAEITGETE